MADWRFYVRDEATKARVALLDEFASVDLVLKFNEPGSWVLESSGIPPATAALADFASGLIAVRDGVVVASGPVLHIDRSWGADGQHLQLAGDDDSLWLARRLAFPDPAHAVGAEAATRDVQTGPAETLLKHYVNVNAGPGALAARRVSGLTIEADAAAGTTLTKRPRYKPLLELLTETALVDGLGFRIVQSGAGVVFEVYQPADRSALVKFSPELGNVDSYTYGADAAASNAIVVGGSGSGLSREFVEVLDSASIGTYGRVEAFDNEQSTSTVGELTDAGEAVLAEAAAVLAFEVRPIDTEGLAYGRDWNLGDLVTVVVDGVAAVAVVRQVGIRVDADGETITPLIGSPGIGAGLAMLSNVRALGARVSDLESTD